MNWHGPLVCDHVALAICAVMVDVVCICGV